MTPPVTAANRPAPLAESATPGREGVRITARAAKVMRDQLQRRGTPEAAIRFGIRGGGCTGFSYLFEYEDAGPRPNDWSTTVDGVTVVVDPKSMIYVEGTEIDFETGMRGHGFRFDNPNASDSCGCGESISF